MKTVSCITRRASGNQFLDFGTARAARLLALLLLLALPAAVRGEDYTYITNNGSITITKYTGPGGAVIIPSTINNLPVSTIGHGTFFSCSNVVTITLPDTVTSIAGVVFTGCTALTAFNVGPQNPAFSSLDGVLFDKTRTALLRCPQAMPGAYTVPNTVTNIGPYAFEGCTGLVGVTLPDALTSLGPDAFLSCGHLASITIPPGVNDIKPFTFGFNSSLTNLTLLGSVTNIENWAFCYTALRTLTLPDTLVTIGTGAFASASFLTTVTLGSSLTTLGDSAFAGASSLTAARFRGNAPTPGTNVFERANRATVYYLPGATGWESTLADVPPLSGCLEYRPAMPISGFARASSGLTSPGPTA